MAIELTVKHREDYLAEQAKSCLKPLGLYLHIPFCVRKCNYCDFVSFPGKEENAIDSYVDRLCEEIAEKGEPLKERYHADTVFLGGGTPSLLSPAQLARILKAVNEHFTCGCEFALQCGSGLGKCDGLEVTLESNPGTFDAEKLRAFADLGVNRLSIGVQSLNDDVLKRLGRIHDSRTALEAMRAARSLQLNYNVDLMLGIPGQTLAIWEDTLKRVLAEEPKHISFYSLQLEMGTPFYRAYRNGEMELPSWEENRAMYHKALDILKEAGFEHYEVSNASRTGYACKHNLKYWTMQDYLGLGMAAHSFLTQWNGQGRILKAVRSFTGSDLDAYLAKRTEETAETLEAWDLKTDFVFTQLRLTEGFRKEDYTRLLGSSFEDDFGEAYHKLKEDGLMTEEGGSVRLTAEGFDQTNPVMEVLLNV